MDTGYIDRYDLMLIIFISTGKRNDEEDAKEKLYTYASHVPVVSFKVCILSLNSLVLNCLNLFTNLGPRDDSSRCTVNESTCSIIMLCV